MKEILKQCLRLIGQESISFGAFDPTPLSSEPRHTFAQEVAEYFASCIPSTTIDLDLYRVLSGVDIASENQKYIPSMYCAPHGFVTIASELNGNAYSVDVTDGRVHCLSHEKFNLDGIRPGYDPATKNALPVVPITRENIIRYAEGYFDSITAFFEQCLDYTKEAAEDM